MTEFSGIQPEQGVPRRDLDPQQAATRTGLFTANQEKIRTILPNLADQAIPLEGLIVKTNQARSLEDQEGIKTSIQKIAGRKGENIQLNRFFVRDHNATMTANSRIIFSGALMVASYDSFEEGIAVSRSVYDSASGGFFEEVGYFDGGIVPRAEDLFAARATSKEIDAEIAAITDVDQRFELVKALAAQNVEQKVKQDVDNYGDLPPSEVLLGLSVMSKSPTVKELRTELAQGNFDTAIAGEILQFIDANPNANPDFAKVRQFMKFVMNFTDTDAQGAPDFYERMIARLDQWPDPQLEVVHNARQTLLNAISENFNRTEQWLESYKMIGSGDANDNFQTAITARLNLAAKKHPLNHPIRRFLLTKESGSGQPRKGRTASKAQNPTPTAESPAATPETAPEPKKLYSFNPNDLTTSEGVEAMVEKFVEAASLGEAPREDLMKVLEFMQRNDLMPGQRPGVKPIRTLKPVPYTDAKGKVRQRKVTEFKPGDATGLPLVTEAVKDSRVIFMRPDDASIAIMGIVPRRDLDDFLARLRDKKW